MKLTGRMKNSDEEFIEKIVALMKADESTDAPADSVKWAKNLFFARAAASAPRKSLLKRVIAVLQTNLSPHETAFGERSAGSHAARQMLFEAGDTSVDLRVTEDKKDVFNLRGQILGENFENSIIEIGEFETRTNELGEFALHAVPRGVYQMTISNDETEIVIDALNLE